MDTNTKPPKEPTVDRLEIQPYMVAIGVLIAGFMFFAIVSVQASNERLLPISLIPLLAGVILQGVRLSGEWRPVLIITVLAFALSFMAFLPGRREHDYSFEGRIVQLPYWFMAMFIIVWVSIYRDKLTAHLTEGIALLQSLALMYWMADYGFDNTSPFVQILMVIAIGLSLFAMIHAFSYIQLSRKARLTLSLWGSVVMLFLAVNMIVRTYNNQAIEEIGSTADQWYVGFQFFVLGALCIYTVQHIVMLIGFLHSFFDEYEVHNSHDLQYAEPQLKIAHASIVALFAVIVYSINFYFKFIPAHLAIWIVFLIVPMMRSAYGRMEHGTGTKALAKRTVGRSRSRKR